MWTLARSLSWARQDAGLSVVLAIQASIMFVVAPLAATGMLAPAVIEAFRFGLAVAAVLMVTRSRRAIGLIAASFLIPMLLSFYVKSGAAATAVYMARLGATSVFDIAVATAVARVAFGPGQVNVHRIMGGVILYLSIGLIFANAYRAAALLLHPSFTGLPDNSRSALSQLLYFSLCTMTTAGFGDIAPLHPFIRSMANLEAVIGQLYPATLLARLVSLHAAGHAAELARVQGTREPAAASDKDRP